MSAFIASCLFVVLAEMGDKTQLLAMAFASRYKASVVMLGVFIATVLNHALAVGVGQFLSQVIPLDIIQVAAAISFIIFGLWTLHADTLGDEDKKVSKFGALATVIIAFFLAEMGDKTQLATISLAIKYQSPYFVLAGTTCGMLIADAIGIVIGVMMHKHLPQGLLHGISAIVFMLFGLFGVYHFLSAHFAAPVTWAIVAALGLASFFASHFILNKEEHGS
jgi:putative Ca2+/H+ antiporter (TMEM165/GDT1 family)